MRFSASLRGVLACAATILGLPLRKNGTSENGGLEIFDQCQLLSLFRCEMEVGWTGLDQSKIPCTQAVDGSI